MTHSQSLEQLRYQLCPIIIESLSTSVRSNDEGIFKQIHTRTRLMAFCLGLPGSAGTRKVKPIWILLKQETVSGSGISWAICKSAPRSRQITTPAPHHSVFYRPDALPVAQPNNASARKANRHIHGHQGQGQISLTTNMQFTVLAYKKFTL